jgi:predicted metal-binding membrane protein
VGGVSTSGSAALSNTRRPGGDLSDAFVAVRARLGLVALLVALAGVAWWSTAGRMAGMDNGPGSDLGTIEWFVSVWVVMMAAMMLPSVSPTVALYARMTRRRGFILPLLFTSGYLLVWAAAGLVAFGLFDVGRTLFGQQLAWDSGGHWFAGGVLAVAALYEVSPLKNVCLAKCRTPLGFLLSVWRDGKRGALEMGARHAAWCVGCCWALMAALFALGVMSLVWMAVVAALITVEKTLPWRRIVTAGTTAVLLILAVGLIVAPHDVPGLVVPGSMGDHMMTMK